MDQLVKNPPTMLETQVGSLGWEGGISFFPVGGNSSTPPYSFLENPMDRGPWQITVHGVAKSHSKKHDWSDLAAAASLHIALHKQILLLLRDFLFCFRPDWNWLLKSGWMPLSKAEKNICLCVLSRFSCVWLFVTPWTVALQAPLSMRFSRQEYHEWQSELPFPSPGDLPHPGIKPCSLLPPVLARGFFTTSTWKAKYWGITDKQKLYIFKVCNLMSWYVCISRFPDGSAGKEATCNARDKVSIPGLGRSPGGGNGNPV